MKLKVQKFVIPTYLLSAEIKQKGFNFIMKSFIEYLKNYGVMIFTTQVTANESSDNMAN